MTGIKGGKACSAFMACISDIIVLSASTLASAGSFLYPISTPLSASVKVDALSTWRFAHATLALVPHFPAFAPASVLP
jgi:hypothetical protein